MHLPADEIVALLIAVSFAAGLNVYATVGALGLLQHTGVITLPAGLTVFSSWYIIAASAALFCVEFFGDKIPAFDLLWNALHTFIRVPIAAHGGKTAARAAVTPSPEPLSNISLSLGEDALAIFLTWMAVKHPYVGA